MNLPLIILAIASAIGGAVVFFLPGFLADVTTGMIPQAADAAHGAAQGAAHGAGHGAAAGGEHGGSHFGEFHFGLTSYLAIAAGAAGIVLAWMMRPQFERGWTPGVERALGAPQNAYEGFWHALVVRGGTALSYVLYKVVDQRIIDKIVEGAGALVNALAESLRTLQTGYVRSYALVMLAGAVFVVACFMVILQRTVGQ